MSRPTWGGARRRDRLLTCILSLAGLAALAPSVPAQTVAQRRAVRGQIELVQQGRNAGALAHVTFGTASRSDWGNSYVRQKIGQWAQTGRGIKQIAAVPGGDEIVLVNDRDEFWFWPLQTHLQAGVGRELFKLVAAKEAIDLVALPPSAATQPHYLIISGDRVIHSGAGIPGKAAATIGTLLGQGKPVDVVAFALPDAWIVVSGRVIYSEKIPSSSRIITVLQNELNKDRRLDDVALDPTVFGKPGKPWGFAFLSNGTLWGGDVSCRTFTNVRDWVWDEGARSTICNESLETAASPAPKPDPEPPSLPMLPNLSFDACSESARTRTNEAVRWLQDNLDKVDAMMGTNGLMDWPGDSRAKFTEKLTKTLEFRCIDSKKACTSGDGLAGRVVPVLHQRRIALCSSYIADVSAHFGWPPVAFYVEVVAHEVGHLVRFNVHRTNCERMYREPRFSQSVGLAALHGFLGSPYDPEFYITETC